MRSITNINGDKITVGCVVEFKCDIEQVGTVKEIVARRDYFGALCSYDLIVTDDDGFIGEHLAGQTVVTIDADDAYPCS